MARKKKRRFKVSPGTWLTRELFESRAFLSLRGFAPQLLILILGKRNIDYNHDCLNCDSLTMTYAELVNKYGITQPRATRAFDELLAKGFLEVKHQGGRCQSDRNIYSLSERWTFWSPGVVFQERKRDVKRGFQKRG